VSDEFFKKIDDPYLKINYDTTKRPHYFAFKDKETELFWLVPCSSKVEKFEAIIAKRKEQNKSTIGMKITIMQNTKTVLLFQDMFPILEKYIEQQYKRRNEPYSITDQKTVERFASNAKQVIYLLIEQNKKLTPTAPNVQRIRKLMLDELSHNKVKDKKKGCFER
jgi:hypothetical protein